MRGTLTCQVRGFLPFRAGLPNAWPPRSFRQSFSKKNAQRVRGIRHSFFGSMLGSSPTATIGRTRRISLCCNCNELSKPVLEADFCDDLQEGQLSGPSEPSPHLHDLRRTCEDFESEGAEQIFAANPAGGRFADASCRSLQACDAAKSNCDGPTILPRGATKLGNTSPTPIRAGLYDCFPKVGGRSRHPNLRSFGTKHGAECHHSQS